MRKRKEHHERQNIGIWILAVSIGICLAGCGNADRAIGFDSVFSETMTETAALQEDLQTQKEHEEHMVCVFVCGAVERAGMYALKEGSRIADALELAGGFAKEADRDAVNLARRITDGEKIYFPRIDEAGGEKKESDPDQKININTADKALLSTLPGIGTAKAEDIISYREKNGIFACCEDIMKVPGIKTAAYEKIKELIRVQ